MTRKQDYLMLSDVDSCNGVSLEPERILQLLLLLHCEGILLVFAIPSAFGYVAIPSTFGYGHSIWCMLHASYALLIESEGRTHNLCNFLFQCLGSSVTASGRALEAGC